MTKKRLSPEQKQFRDELIRTLKEKHKEPRQRLAKIIGVCGIDFCRDILAQAQEIEAQRGTLIGGEAPRIIRRVKLYG